MYATNNQEYQEEFEQPNDHVSIRKPVENIVSLKKRQSFQDHQQLDADHIIQQGHKSEQLSSHNNLEEISKNPQLEEQQKQNQLKQLRDQLNAKHQQVTIIKKAVADKKKRIRQIGLQVDKQMNKSLFRQNKFTQAVKIHQIFGKKNQNNNGKIKQLRQQLERLRVTISKQKQQNKKFSASFTDPLSSSNHEKYLQLDTKIKQRQQKIKQIQQQRVIMNRQIQRIKLDTCDQFDYDYDGDIKRTKQQGSQLLTKLKQQRQQLYELEKQDIASTQKMCYLKEVIETLLTKKKHQTLDPSEKEHIQKGIKDMSVEIRQAMDQKFKTEAQRTSLVKILSQQVKNYENKNWELIQSLRQIDSYFLKLYSAKYRDPRNSVKKQQKQRAQKSAIYTFKQTEKDDLFKNDKNMHFESTQVKLQPVLVEKRKHFQIGMVAVDDYAVIMNDEFLGLKNNLLKICIVCDQDYIYGIHGQYSNQKDTQMTGLNMLSRIKPKQLQTKSLLIDKNEGQILQKMQVGLSKEGNVKFLLLQTSKQNKLQWGSLDRSNTNQSKMLRKYESINLKAKLVQIGQKSGPNSYCLGGIGFSIVYFGVK